MGDGLEARVAVLEAAIPFVRQAIDEHKSVTASYHRESLAARAHTDEKLEELTRAVEARENQAKGAVWLANTIIVGLGVVGGAIGYFVAKVFPVLARLG